MSDATVVRAFIATFALCIELVGRVILNQIVAVDQ